MRSLMRKNEASEEQYKRLGIPQTGEITRDCLMQEEVDTAWLKSLSHISEDKKKLLLILSSYLTAAERTGLVNKFSHEIESYNINLLLAFLTEQNFISCDNIDIIKKFL